MIGHICSLVFCLIVDGLRYRIDLRIVRTVVLRLVAVVALQTIAVCRIDEHVEGIIVEVEVVTILLRHRTEGVEGTVGLASLEVLSTVESALRTVVGIGEVVFQEVGCISIRPSGIAGPQLCLQLSNVVRREQLTGIDVVRGGEFQEVGTYLCFLNMFSQCRPLGVSIA